MVGNIKYYLSFDNLKLKLKYVRILYYFLSKWLDYEGKDNVYNEVNRWVYVLFRDIFRCKVF